MRRYRGSDKPPASTLSPPPYSRNATSRRSINNGSARRSTDGSGHHSALSGLTTPMSENELFMMHNIGTASAQFLDPRTKKPMIPPAGRTVPKLKMADLTSSLAPLVERQMAQQQKTSITVADKRIADTLKEVTTSKDMLESFDDAVKVPDMRAINAKVAHLRKGIGATPNPNANKVSSSRQVNNSLLKTKVVSSVTRKPNASKVSPNNEEQSIRQLMDQLKDKYLGDMESQLGLAIERRPRESLQGELLNENSLQDQKAGGSRNYVGIPRPSTNASEITSRIDKVVREWATESQKLSTVMKVPTFSKQHSSAGGMTKINNYPSTEAEPTFDINGNIVEHNRQKAIKTNPQDSNATPGKNKNLARISSAFRKSLDPISKRDVRELIRIPEDDHIEKMEQEHKERIRAHESVFKNAVISTSASSVDDKGARTGNKRGERKTNKAKEQNKKQASRNGTTDSIESGSESTIVEQNRTKSSLVTHTNPRTLAKKGEDEAYSIIKEHLEYENSSGPPKLTKTRKAGEMIKNQSAKPALLRSDAVGKALLKYSDSHKKLQTVVDSFTEKVDVGIRKRPGPTVYTQDSEQSEEDVEKNVKLPASLPVASAVNLSTVNSRRRNASEANTTLSRSMRTIGRASSVAQRLGTLMSRVALRNEAYDYEKQQEALQKSNSVASTDNDDVSGQFAIAPQSPIKSLSSPPQYEYDQPNPYEMSKSFTNTRRDLERPNVSHGVSKLDSSHFGKYVEEMKKVADKAAESFEKFKMRQVKNDADLTSEEEASASEYSYKGNGEAAAVAAAAAEIVAIQEQEKKRKTALQHTMQSQQQRKPMSKNSPRKTANKKYMSDAGTSPRKHETAELLSQINRNYGSDTVNNNNNNNSTKQGQFKFVPDMSYTDQLMLQKLRKLKESEGWENPLLSERFGTEDETVIGDVPQKDDIESMIKRSTNMNLPREPERASMGPISLNAILRSRRSNNDNGNK